MGGGRLRGIHKGSDHLEDPLFITASCSLTYCVEDSPKKGPLSSRFWRYFKVPERFYPGRLSPPSLWLFLLLFTFAWGFAFPSAQALGQFTEITVTAPTGCVTVGETIAVTAIFGPTNQQDQTDDYSIGFGNASTIAWPGGCTAANNTGSLPTSDPVTVVESVTVPATVSGNWTTVDVVGIQDSTYLCGGSTVIGSASIDLCSTLYTPTFTPTHLTNTPTVTPTHTHTGTPTKTHTITLTPTVTLTPTGPLYRYPHSNGVTLRRKRHYFHCEQYHE